MARLCDPNMLQAKLMRRRTRVNAPGVRLFPVAMSRVLDGCGHPDRICR